MIPPLIFVAIWQFFLARGANNPQGALSIGKSKAKVYVEGEAEKITFADVAGVEEAKTELVEIVDFLKTPARYTAIDANVSRSNQHLTVAQEDFAEAIERVVAGLEKKSRVLNETEKKIVAYHEVGHALVGALTGGSGQVEKISIVPRYSEDDRRKKSFLAALRRGLLTICNGQPI